MPVEPLPIAKNASVQTLLLPSFANRHGLIAGATGTGKTVTLQAMTEQFSKIGVPVFMADVKGDLAGISQPGEISSKMASVLKDRGIELPKPFSCPTVLWDVFGEQGHPVRATISDMGPLLLARMLDLNETQSGVLNLVFRVADDDGLLLLDLKDFQAMLQHVGENAKAYTTEYGNVSPASIGAIQRAILRIDEQGGEAFFGEPMLNIADLMRTDEQGHGVVNILSADKLLLAPQLYATFLLWMLSELFELLPEVGDLEKPKLVFFFDEAHLLFDQAPDVLIERIELVVRLIRSKGVGVYFVSQSPQDIPDGVLGQLGHRVQHALRAFTPRDQKALKAIAQTMRPKEGLDIQSAVAELAVGEALISFLDAKGVPTQTERAYVIPPGSQIGPISKQQRKELLEASSMSEIYNAAVDRESAYEILQERAQALQAEVEQSETENSAVKGIKGRVKLGKKTSSGRRGDSIVKTAIKGVVRAASSSIGRQIIRGILGAIKRR